MNSPLSVLANVEIAAARCEHEYKQLGLDTPGCGLGAGGLLADVLWLAGRAEGLRIAEAAMSGDDGCSRGQCSKCRDGTEYPFLPLHNTLCAECVDSSTVKAVVPHGTVCTNCARSGNNVLLPCKCNGVEEVLDTI